MAPEPWFGHLWFGHQWNRHYQERTIRVISGMSRSLSRVGLNIWASLGRMSGMGGGGAAVYPSQRVRSWNEGGGGSWNRRAAQSQDGGGEGTRSPPLPKFSSLPVLHFCPKCCIVPFGIAATAPSGWPVVSNVFFFFCRGPTWSFLWSYDWM